MTCHPQLNYLMEPGEDKKNIMKKLLIFAFFVMALAEMMLMAGCSEDQSSLTAPIEDINDAEDHHDLWPDGPGFIMNVDDDGMINVEAVNGADLRELEIINNNTDKTSKNLKETRKRKGFWTRWHRFQVPPRRYFYIRFSPKRRGNHKLQYYKLIKTWFGKIRIYQRENPNSNYHFYADDWVTGKPFRRILKSKTRKTDFIIRYHSSRPYWSNVFVRVYVDTSK